MANSILGNDDIRSHFEEPREGALPSNTHPCQAPDDFCWVHSYALRSRARNPLLIGKWLIRVTCQHVEYCWGQVRDATENGSLGFAAKVSTDWGNRNDPAQTWRPNDHMICAFTRDWSDYEDVRRVAGRLAEIDAVRTQTLQYKLDIGTRMGIYSGNHPGLVALYTSAPPYPEVRLREGPLDELRALFERSDATPDLTGISASAADIEEARERITHAVLRVRS